MLRPSWRRHRARAWLGATLREPAQSLPWRWACACVNVHLPRYRRFAQDHAPGRALLGLMGQAMGRPLPGLPQRPAAAPIHGLLSNARISSDEEIFCGSIIGLGPVVTSAPKTGHT